MKKGLYILGVFAFLLAFTACEKCEKPAISSDPFATVDENNASTRGGEVDRDPVVPGSAGVDGDITDPEEDEDFDGIVDPDEDEDFDVDSDGK